MKYSEFWKVLYSVQISPLTDWIIRGTQQSPIVIINVGKHKIKDKMITVKPSVSFGDRHL